MALSCPSWYTYPCATGLMAKLGDCPMPNAGGGLVSLSVKKTGCRWAESWAWWACLSQAAWKGAMSCGGMGGGGGGGGLGWDIVSWLRPWSV